MAEAREHLVPLPGMSPWSLLVATPCSMSPGWVFPTLPPPKGWLVLHARIVNCDDTSHGQGLS